MAPYLKGFTNFSVIGEFASFFPLHVVDGLEVFFVEGLLALFVVLRDARVVPAFVLDRACVFVPSRAEVPVGLADVCGCAGAGACIFVDAFFLVGMWLGFVFAA